ncbi:hypothetical protein [Ralstonia solanacearum]|nr:hypothetical protein [Ralstonia solanacearum]
MQQQHLRPAEILAKTLAVRLIEQVLDLAVTLIHVPELELRVGRLLMAGRLQLADVPRGGAPAKQGHDGGPRQTFEQRSGPWIGERLAAVRFSRRSRTA